MEKQKGKQIIHAESLSRTYDMGHEQVVGIDNINLDISQGEMVALKGNSGSGKSTLLSLIAGLDQPTGGALVVSGYDLNKSAQEKLTLFRREIVGMIFQSFNLLPTLTVLENICLPAILAAKPDKKIKFRANELLEWLNLGNRSGHRPAQLSGGELQRTAIARALINDPDLILADEPTGNLDSKNGEAVIHLLADLNQKQGRTVIIATHSAISDPFATKTICLKDGKITG